MVPRKPSASRTRVRWVCIVRSFPSKVTDVCTGVGASFVMLMVVLRLCGFSYRCVCVCVNFLIFVKVLIENVLVTFFRINVQHARDK